jgi:hypothetical protein
VRWEQARSSFSTASIRNCVPARDHRFTACRVLPDALVLTVREHTRRAWFCAAAMMANGRHSGALFGASCAIGGIHMQ